MTAEPARAASELRRYLIRLISTLGFGIFVMASVATWAWHHYSKRLADAPPLPPGKPPFNNGASP